MIVWREEEVRYLLPCQCIDMHQGGQVDNEDRDGPQHTTVQPQDVSIRLQSIRRSDIGFWKGSASSHALPCGPMCEAKRACAALKVHALHKIKLFVLKHCDIALEHSDSIIPQ